MDTSEDILQASTELFFRYGVKSISMDEIAVNLGISKKTIYRFFENKDALVMAFAEDFTKKQEEQITKIIEVSANVIEELLHLSDFLRTKVCNINPALIFDLKKYYPKAWKLAEDHRNVFMTKCVQESLRKGIETGHFRKTINPDILALMRVHQVNMACDDKVFPPDAMDFLEVQMQLFDHFVYGICTLKGHKLFNQYRQIQEDE